MAAPLLPPTRWPSGVERPEDRATPAADMRTPYPSAPRAEDPPARRSDQHVVRHGERGGQGDEDDDGARQALLPEGYRTPPRRSFAIRALRRWENEGHVHEEQAKRTARKLAPLMKRRPRRRDGR